MSTESSLSICAVFHSAACVGVYSVRSPGSGMPPTCASSEERQWRESRLRVRAARIVLWFSLRNLSDVKAGDSQASGSTALFAKMFYGSQSQMGYRPIIRQARPPRATVFALRTFPHIGNDALISALRVWLYHREEAACVDNLGS